MVAAKEHYINNFFARFDDFDYKPASFIHEEFYRLAEEKGWSKKEKKEEMAALKDAMVLQFNQEFGLDENDLSSWQQLCSALGASPIPDNILECRRLVTSTHVNLVDFIESSEPGKPVKTFATEVELSTYTRKMGKFFPRDNVHSGSLLRCLLRHILNPSTDRDKPKRRGRPSAGSGRARMGSDGGQRRGRRSTAPY